MLFLNYLKMCVETLSVILKVFCEVFWDRFKVAGYGLVWSHSLFWWFKELRLISMEVGSYLALLYHRVSKFELWSSQDSYSCCGRAEAAELLWFRRSSVVTPGNRLLLVSELLLQSSSFDPRGQMKNSFSNKSTKKTFFSKTKTYARKLSW